MRVSGDLDHMWLFTTDGFFSAVAYRDEPDAIIVRARVGDDALRLVEAARQGEVIETPDRDYRFRVYLARDDWSAYVAGAAAAIDYPNFKEAVAARQGPDRPDAYAALWSAMFELQQHAVDPSPSQDLSAGSNVDAAPAPQAP